MSKSVSAGRASKRDEQGGESLFGAEIATVALQ